MTRAFALVLSLLLSLTPALAQSSSPSTQQQPSVPEAGGPQGNTGPVAVPRKSPEQIEQEKQQQQDEQKPPKVKNPAGMPDYTLRVNVPLVNLDVSVLTKDGQFIPGLKKENFKIYEDGAPQPITNFSQDSNAPITAVLLVEFASTTYYFVQDMMYGAYSFAQTLKPDDWVALISYDMKPHIVTDFTQDKRQVYAGLHSLQIPGFAETNMFDALYDTVDRLDRVEGRKYVILISTGCDSFSKLTWDKIQNKLKNTRDITIFTVGTGQAMRLYYESHNALRALPCTGANFEEGAVQMDFLQADNQMSTIARMTGGRSYFPRFAAGFPDVFQDIAATIRNEYSISYHPTNTKQDGSWRKIKVELQAPDGGPLTVKDQHGKNIKFQVVARDGYRAKNIVE